ncbi:MAG: hypothetical protein K6E73_04405 [Bacteroidales bacterium]|nr:hypothetical protein [Bacteroidales bacterium]
MRKYLFAIFAVMLMPLATKAGTKTIVWDNATMHTMEIHQNVIRNFDGANEVFTKDGISLSIRGIKDTYVNVENSNLESSGTLVFQSSVGNFKRIEIYASTTSSPSAEWCTGISGIYWEGDAQSVNLKSGDSGTSLTLTGLQKISFMLESDGVAINETNFPDANFRNWVLSQSYGTDNVLLQSEIENVTSIDVGSKNIQSLKGIEFFTALKSLTCYNNQLTMLDVSKNTALTTLNCSNNQLTTLDVSACKKLSTLECYCNQIKDDGMDAFVQNLPNASYGYMNVIYSIGEQNVMTKAQVATAKAKGWTPLCMDPSYGWREYEGFEDSNPPAPTSDIEINEKNFPDARFRNWLFDQMIGYDGVLTQSEIANTTSISVTDRYIESLKGIEFFTALTSLSCYRNQLTELDVSKNTALTNLSCNSNQLTALDVSKNTALTGLSCSDNQLTTLDVTQNTALTSVSCTGNQLTTLDVSNCTNLTILNCYSNQIKGEGMDALVRSLPTVSNGTINVLYNKNEQNVMNTIQVAAAKAKGWTPQWMDINYGWREYQGSQPESTVISDTITMRPSLTATVGAATTVSGITTSLGSEDEVNPEEGSITLHTAMTANQVTQLMESAAPGSSDFAKTFKGIYFELTTGKGTIELDIETLGSYQMSVMKGSELLGNYTQTSKGTVIIKYDLDADTWFFAYPAIYSSSNKLRRAASANGGLKVFGVKIIHQSVNDTDGLNGVPTSDPSHNEREVYDLSGRKMLNGQSSKVNGLKKDIYIVNGKKVLF